MRFLVEHRASNHVPLSLSLSLSLSSAARNSSAKRTPTDSAATFTRRAEGPDNARVGLPDRLEIPGVFPPAPLPPHPPFLFSRSGLNGVKSRAVSRSPRGQQGGGKGRGRGRGREGEREREREREGHSRARARRGAARLNEVSATNCCAAKV